FYREFELLQDIDVPLGAVVIQNDKGIIVHGKDTLQLDSKLPTRIGKGRRVRFRQEIRLDVAVGEYTFEIGLGAMTTENYQRRDQFDHMELQGKFARLCTLSRAGRFLVLPRSAGKPVHL